MARCVGARPALWSARRAVDVVCEADIGPASAFFFFFRHHATYPAIQP